MAKLLLFVFSIFYTVFAISQDRLNNLDFCLLDSSITKSKIIGAGESTHGTSEFSLIRLELFKDLVQKHDFNIFFLEADFSACQRINRYIHGENDSVHKALLEVRLWPWLTEEMIELIEWCKEFNSTNNQRINFVGCDMQLIEDDYIELTRELDSNFSSTIDSIFLDLNQNSTFSFVQERNKRWIDFKKVIDSVDGLNYSNDDFAFISLTVDQWFKSMLNTGVKYNFRDSCMAVNMLKYLDLTPRSKGMYFAHNWHVSNTFYAYKSFHPTKTTGAFLKEKLQSQYTPVGFVASEFQFNALTCEDGTMRMKQFFLNKNKRKDLERLFSKSKSNSIEIYQSSAIDNISRYNITSIGATYEKDCDGFKPRSSRPLNKEMFEVFIYIKKASATDLIVQIKIKYS